MTCRWQLGGTEGLLRLRIFSLSDLVVMLDKISLAGKLHLLSIIVPVIATLGTETTALSTRVLETRA